MSEEESALARKYLELCQVLVQKRQAFSFTLKTSPFSITLDTKEKAAPLESRKVKKKLSLSALKRNQNRKEAFLKKKSDSNESDEQHLEETPKDDEENTFKCNQCENSFNSDKGLKIHIGKAHKEIEKLRSSSTEEKPLTVSPEKGTRTIPCHNCGEDMSPTHLCQQEELNSPTNTTNHICHYSSKFMGPICGKKFNTFNELSDHNYEAHWKKG